MTEINIIDSLKNTKSKRTNKKIYTIHIIVAILLYAGYKSKIDGYNIFEYIGVNLIWQIAIAFLFIFTSIFIIVRFYVNIRTKGTVLLSEDNIQIKLKNKSTMIPLNNLYEITTYIFKDHENELNYWMEVNNSDKKYLFELDIIFQREREEFQKMLEIWKENNSKITVKKTAPNIG